MRAILGDIVTGQQIRQHDSAGSGYFGASRKRKEGGVWRSIPNAHKGIDIVSYVRQSVLSPIDGRITKVGVAYSDDKRFQTIHIKGNTACFDGITIKLLYVEGTVSVGSSVTRGQAIGLAQDISLKYKGITNHVHIEVYENGILQNPTNLFGSDTCSEESEIEDTSVEGDQENDDGQTNDRVNMITYTAIQNASIDDFLLSDRFTNIDVDKQTFLDFEYKGKTNHFRLWEGLAYIDKRIYNKNDANYNKTAEYPISQGTTVYVLISTITIERSYESNITITKTQVANYFPQVLRTLTNDPGYVPAYKNRGIDAKDIYPHITVWIWSRTKYLEGSGNGFVDVTKDITNCTIATSIGDGGNFNIRLAPIIGELIENENDRGDKSTSWERTDDIISMDGNSNQSVSLGNVNKERVFKANQTLASEYIRNHFYYDKILQQNDMVFISFEKLKLNDEGEVNEVGGRWYDMMGLIDVSQISTTGQNTDVSINIRGRDLFKVLQEDNSYFNPYSIGHANSLYGGQFGERYLQGEFKEVAALLPRTIKDAIEFVFHRIASIGYVPDDVFGEFSNKTEITKSDKSGEEEKETKGIWQVMKVFVDQNIRDLRVVDDSVSNPQGTIVDIIRKIAQEPFVELITDTYGDKFYLMFRQPPFTYESVSDIIWNIEEVNEDFSSFEGDQQTPVGSANSINKYKSQESKKNPGSDTTNEKEDLWIDDDVTSTNSLDEVTVSASEYPRVININEDDILNDNLQYDNKSYAWFKLTNRGNFAGNTVSLGHVPSIYFDEYAQVFGNKMLDVTNNYSDYSFFEHKGSEQDIDLYAEQASQLLAFMVETNMYLPFTRKGSITMNGDRRIKKGNWIYYRATNEVFYVVGVDQNVAINEGSMERTTTIRVERGMVKSFIKPKIVSIVDENGNAKTVEASYFDIVNIEKLRNGIYDTVTKGSASDKFDYKADMLINTDVFNFFLQRKQSKLQSFDDV